MPHLPIQPAHLGLGATVAVEPPFTGMDWYADYTARHAADGFEGRLVSMHDFTEDWDGWEMHPNGPEMVVCTAGRLTLVQEHPDGRVERVTLSPGDYAINAPGVWHTAEIDTPCTALFITSGIGTEHRPR